MTRAEESVRFLKEEVPLLLAELTPDTKPLWGIMTPQHMVEHLQLGLSLTTGAKIVPVVSAWYTRPFLKFFILSKRPFPKHVRLPGYKRGYLPPLKYKSLDEAKEHLLQAIKDTLHFMRTSPEVRTNHPYGGRFTPNDWRIFQKKHFVHHFRQFNLLPS